MCLVFVAVAAVIVYRIIMTIDYCGESTPATCLILTSVISAVLNAAAILILGKVTVHTHCDFTFKYELIIFFYFATLC